MLRSVQSSWILMPEFLERIKSFDMEGADQVAAAFEQSFLRDDGQCLGIALLGADKRLHGHLVACIHQTLGAPWGMIYQFSKDRPARNARETNTSIELLLEMWAGLMGIDTIIAKVKTESRARLFGRFGFSKDAILVKKEMSVVGAHRIGAEVRPLRAVGGSDGR